MSTPLPPFPQPQEPSDEPVLMELTAPSGAPQLRADAARNRARLLEAAARLVEEHGVAKVTMDAVAAAAAVGKGTVFRRFGDRTGLLMALLDHTEQRFQTDFISGPPPLGPGAPPVERLHAFGCRSLRQASEQLDLFLAAEPDASRRFSSAPYRVRFMHVCMLLRQANPAADIELVAQTLMGYLDPALIHHLTRQRDMPLERLEAGWHYLVDRSTRPHPA
ncbi:MULTISPECIES: TetR/AcrR family transcriptional regulator [Streptomyces]|uniref:TetR/AcrR family transcriptional regulator n=1 Tax=Streptomyces dengpaensis TaxID=2049881 RepID=A0ABM6T051_9ACTN|nr:MULTISPECIES: TetR/AcrR family transcriptional regulator [Streptomyces]AVH60535.1 TetR/AcrR family transcriptional regulator [Streptomyces dengpaensis]PIB07540.1 TetR family transcriptional regulator [Streptomyces sp. HG99]